MENKATGRLTKEVIERHRSNTRKYLHLVENFAATGQKIDPEATKAKIEEKYGLKLKTAEQARTPCDKPALTHTEKFSLDEQAIKAMISSIRSKYCEKPSLSAPPQVFFPRPSSPETTVSAPTTPASQVTDTQLIDLSPVKPDGEARDWLSSSPPRTSKGYVDDLLGISFPVQTLPPHEDPIRLAEAVAVKEADSIVSTETESDVPKKSGKPRAEDVLNSIISEVVGRFLRPAPVFQPEPVPEAKLDLLHTDEEIPSPRIQIVSPGRMRSFDTFLRGGKPEKTAEPRTAKVRPGRVQVTKAAKPDLETLFSKDSELQRLMEKEKRLIARLQEVAEEKRSLLAEICA